MRGKILVLHTVSQLLETLVYLRYKPRIPHLSNLSHSWNQDSLSPGTAAINNILIVSEKIIQLGFKYLK